MVLGSLAAANDVVALNIEKMPSAVIEVAGAFSGTITFEASLSGQSWTAFQVVKQSTNAAGPTTTTTGLFLVHNAGVVFVRARMSSYASGTASIAISAGQGGTIEPAQVGGVTVSTSSITAELDTLHSVAAGTATASKALVADANKSVDVLQATTSESVGGTGVPGAAAVATLVTKAVTGFADTTAKDVFTVTVPNAAHAASIELGLVGVLGAGGSVGAGESTMSSTYKVAIVRTAGLATVAVVGTVYGSANAGVAGSQAITSVVATVSAMTGANSATQTFTIKVAITRAGATATNHTLVATAFILNQNASGITIA